jgi:hypothetical protein
MSDSAGKTKCERFPPVDLMRPPEDPVLGKPDVNLIHRAEPGDALSLDGSGRVGHNAGVGGPCHSRCRLAFAPPCEYGRGRACRYHRQCPACETSPRAAPGE